MKFSSNTLSMEEDFNQSTEENSRNLKRGLTPPPVVTSQGKSKLEESLTSLVKLIANITESYTASIFVAETKRNILHSLAFQSLSRDYIPNVQIPYSSGLVGWTAENKVRIAVCPFENDSRTLLYYKADQSLKSFIAVPILDTKNNLVGVISCDSKKSYAFPKITEKLLEDCAVQANLLIDLHLKNEELSREKDLPAQDEKIESFISSLSNTSSEEELLSRVKELPEAFITRDAILSFSISHEGYGEPTFYPSAKDKRIEQHLVDLVCKQKRIVVKEKSLHVLPAEDIRARTFLSVPLNAFEREAGTLNVLSKPFKAFSPKDIEVLELLAKATSRELERVRAKSISNSRQIGPSMLPWDSFLKKASIAIDHNRSNEHGFLRLSFDNLSLIEGSIGIQTTVHAHEQLLRFVQQLGTHPLFTSAPYGTSVFVFGDVRLLNALLQRVVGLISKIDSNSLNLPGMSFPKGSGQVLAQNLRTLIIPLKKGSSYSEFALRDVISTNLVEQVDIPLVNPISTTLDTPTKTEIAETPKRESSPRVRDDKPSTEDLIRGHSRKDESSHTFTLGAVKNKEKQNAKFW